MAHPFENGCMHAEHQAQTRALVSVIMKKLMVVDVVGLLFSFHCSSYHLNALETQTQW